MQRTKGFTLIELLVVVVLITILTGVVLVVINPSQIRKRARDSQRISDIKYIQTALEQYYMKMRAYPSASTSSDAFILVAGTSNNLYNQLVTTAGIVTSLPSDPVAGSALTNPCTNTASSRYNYYAPRRAEDSLRSDSYVLTAIMETVSSNDGNECGRLNKWGSGATFCSATSPPPGALCPGNGLGAANNAAFETCDYCFGVESK